MDKKTRLLLSLIIVAMLLLTVLYATNALYPAQAQEDDEEVSISIFAVDGGETELTPDLLPTPAPTIDPAVPVYEGDGSIVVTLSFAGDFTIGDNVQSGGKSIFQKELDKQKGDIHFPFRNIKALLLEDDISMINFEGTLTTEGRNPDKKNNDFLFRAAPDLADMLTPGGVDTVTLENNHVLDMGETGLAETKQVLAEAGIPYASEGEPAVFYAKGVKIGSLAYQTFGGRHDELLQKVPGDIAALREEGCDVVIVSYHWGAELDYAPNDNQIRLGRGTIDAGADVVIGHHSHRINPIECYKGKYICYSLGNFAFAGNSKPSDMASFVFQLRLKVKDGAAEAQAMRIVPIRISSRTDYNDFAPTPYEKDTHIEAVQKVLKQNGKKLEYAVETYPLVWPEE